MIFYGWERPAATVPVLPMLSGIILRHNNTEVLESGYGISMRSLTLFAENMYDKQDPMEAAAKAISVIMLKLEGRLIKAHPEYGMNDMLLLDKMV